MSIANASFSRSGFSQEKGGVWPRFYMESVQDPLSTAREGRPIFHDEERVELLMPGNNLTKPVMKVTDEHRDRWPEVYKKFKAGMEMAPDGTPIEEWPILGRAMIAELRALEIRTVEQVACLDDLACQRIGMGGTMLRLKAKAFLDDSEHEALTQQLSQRNEHLEFEVSSLRGQVAEMQVSMQRMFDQMQTNANAHHPIATAVPGQADALQVQAAAFVPQMRDAAPSALDRLSAPRRGRPPRTAT